MWVESVVCSLPCSERYFPAYSDFSLSSKTKRLLKFPIPIPIPAKNQFELFVFIYFTVSWNLNKVFSSKIFLDWKKGIVV